MSSCKNLFKSINDFKNCIYKFSAMLTKAPDIIKNFRCTCNLIHMFLFHELTLTPSIGK